MNVYILMDKYKENNRNGHFFDHKTLKFFGERLSEMYVLKKTEIIKGQECYILSSRQRPPFGKPIRVYHYFDVNTFENII